MLFVKDIHPQNTEQTTGCAFIGTACGNKKGEAVGIVDMTWEGYSRSQHIQKMARTLAHEFGHMVSLGASKYNIGFFRPFLTYLRTLVRLLPIFVTLPKEFLDLDGDEGSRAFL